MAPKVFVLLTAIAAWIAIALGAIANGSFREAVLIPALGNRIAQVLSMALLLTIILLVAAVVVALPAWRSLSRRTLLAIGVAWAVGSIIFEFVLGLAILGMTWSEVLGNYNILEGKLWPLAPLTMAFAPMLMRYTEKAASSRWPLFARLVAR